MEENNNINGERKVLISVKVSTLLLIFVVLVAAIVAFVKISNLDKEETKAVTSTSSTSVETEEVEEPVKKEPIKITARSSGIRDMAEVQEIENGIEENTQPEIVEEPAQEEVEPAIEEVIEAPQTTPIEEVTIARDMDLTVRTGLSREDFITLISDCKADTSGFFEENAGLIYDLCEKYSLNEIFFCGLISAESGWTIAQNHRNTHNYISLMSSGGLIRFESVESGLEKAAETLHNKYLTPGGSFYYGPTLAAMKTKFCPASSTWVDLVYGRMAQIVK